MPRKGKPKALPEPDITNDISSSNAPSIIIETESIAIQSQSASEQLIGNSMLLKSDDVVDDIESICSNVLGKVKHLWAQQKVNAFTALNDKLIVAGSRSFSEKSSLKPGNSINKMESAGNAFAAAQSASVLYDNRNVAVPNKKMLAKLAEKPKTLGKGWFDLQPIELTDTIKRDLKLIQLRNYLDPKRFYKNPDKGGKIIHIGTVIEGPTEYTSARLTKNERRKTIVEEVLADHQLKSYTKRTFLNIQDQKSKKRKIFSNKKGKQKKAKKHGMDY